MRFEEKKALITGAFGGLDSLVNDAGIVTRGKITEARDDDFARPMAVNVKVQSRLCRVDSVADHPQCGPGATIEVEKSMCWLGSKETSFVTGQVGTIDVGCMAQLSFP